MFQVFRQVLCGVAAVAVAIVALVAAPSFAGMDTNQLLDAASWPDDPEHITTGAGNLQTDFNVEVTIAPSGAASHTFVPSTTFKLDKMMIRVAGAPTTGLLYLYPEPVGGTDSDGFVNNGFSVSVLNGGAGLPYTFFGTGTRALLEFDLTDADEVYLSAGTKYSLDLVNNGTGTMYWMRAGTAAYLNAYSPGNIYARNPAPDGQRFDVGPARRDGTLALYKIPEPASVVLVGVALAGLALARRRQG